jgi:hypothetical protein
MKLSITRALSELKLLSSRIERAISDSNLIITHKKSAKKVDTIHTPEEFTQNAKASYQSITDLINRRKAIKSAIVKSNAETFVTINGKSMSVAEAIERKDSISFEQTLLNHMKSQLNSAKALCQRSNDVVQLKLDELLITTFGKEGKAKVSPDEIESVSKPYLAQNEWEVLDILKLEIKIKELSDEIEGFLAECDYVLVTSNCITQIEIPD